RLTSLCHGNGHSVRVVIDLSRAVAAIIGSTFRSTPVRTKCRAGQARGQITSLVIYDACHRSRLGTQVADRAADADRDVSASSVHGGGAILGGGDSAGTEWLWPCKVFNHAP